MKNHRPSKFPVMITVVLLCLACVLENALADNQWDFTVGGGFYRDSVYAGSDDFYVVPVPIARASYARGNLSFYLSLLNGIGVSWFNEEKGLTASTSVRYGQERDSREYSLMGIMAVHSERTKRLLADTPTASAPVVYDATISCRALKGTIEASVEWYPTSVDYHLAGQQDRDFNGLIYSLFYSLEDRLTERYLFSGKVGVQFMNQGYADAWYTVRYLTAELDAFAADAGLADAKLSLQVTRMFSEKAGVSLLGTATLFMADAGTSPYTTEKFQPATLLFAFYNF